jgi:catechol 2,3-dioxygenase-like lactoylglutathione lyase family enzyme
VPAALIPLLHVTDMERSIAFYERLGLEPEAFFEQEGWLLWCRLRSDDEAELMLTFTGDPPHVHEGTVALYLFVEDLDVVAGLGPVEKADPSAAQAVRLQDPDGYEILVAAR